jgi:16S rRNA (adenine1518-N6/adenine1519-N6)-dimethyltransferase
VTVVRADILEISPRELGLPAGYVVAANIPYYITSPILRHVLESEPKPRRVVLTVQQEVAARICAEPPDMSVLALSVQVYGGARIVAAIPAAAFYPVPRVNSAVVCIDRYDEPAVPPSLLAAYFSVVKAGFSQPRKMLSNTLAAGLGISAADARAELVRTSIDPRRRAETLSLSEWARLSEALLRRLG